MWRLPWSATWSTPFGATVRAEMAMNLALEESNVSVLLDDSSMQEQVSGSLEPVGVVELLVHSQIPRLDDSSWR